MTGQGGARGDFCGFVVADLAHHDDIRILAQDGAQHPRKIEPDTGMHLHLTDALKTVFHGIFHGENLALYTVDLIQCRIQRRGFT